MLLIINTVPQFNNQVATSDVVIIESLTNPVSQESCQESWKVTCFIPASCIANKAHIQAVSAPHTAFWITMVPSVSLGLHLDPSEFQVAIKWWLGMDT